MKAAEVNFKKGMEVTINKKSQYGKEFDETLNCKVVATRNYKNRGQKIELLNTDLNYIFSIWKEEYAHNINL